jgi:protein-S-isoprenylcysteine O-methyltransferase Ste14
MQWILPGCLGFLLLYLFDYNKVRFIHKMLNQCFAAATLILLGCTVALYNDAAAYAITPRPLSVAFFVLALLFGGLVIHALFLSLPFEITYLYDGRQGGGVVTSGQYALCRHPGVIWLFLAYLALWLSRPSPALFVAWLVWSAMDLLHVWVQDVYFFPRTIAGYEEYKKHTPFLIPNAASIRRCLASMGRR